MGIHVSDKVRAIGLKMGYIAPQYADKDSMNMFRVCLGLAWEDFAFPHLHPETDYHPGEMILEGMAGTCDGVYWFDSGKRRISECKLTWKSMKRARNLEDEWLWLAQTKCYCKMWDTNLARYHIGWVNGNYAYGTPDGEPQYCIYDLEFTSRELNENFLMLKNYKM